MDSKKFEQMLEEALNENYDAARELFHEIIVEKSRELYEEAMAEEWDMEEGMHGGSQVDSLLDEIDAEESGEGAEDEFGDESDDDMPPEGDDSMPGEGDDELKISGDDEDLSDRLEDLEDRVVSAEERIEDLFAEFEKELGGGEEAAGEEDEEEGAEELGAGEEEEEEGEEEEEESESGGKGVMEAALVPVKKPAGGGNGANATSPVAHKAKMPSPAGAVNWTQGSAAGRSAPKVAPGKTYGNTGLGHKPHLSAAPKAHTKDTTHSRSPLGESKTTKRTK